MTGNKKQKKKNIFINVFDLIKLFILPKKQIKKIEEEADSKDIYPLW